MVDPTQGPDSFADPAPSNEPPANEPNSLGANGDTSLSTWVSQATVASADRPPRLEAGRRFGPYILVRPLGCGGQAAVWEAERDGHPALVVALKVFAASYRPDRLEAVARLGLQAAPGGPLAGSAILPVLDWGQADGHVYFALPVIDGPDLGAVLGWRRDHLAGRPCPVEDPLAMQPPAEYLWSVVAHLGRIARALETTHALGLAHSDIKPTNIFLDRRGRAYLADFGIAHPLVPGPDDLPWMMAGTPAYMPREKLLGAGSIDEACCDIYALGVTLYEATTMRLPFWLPPKRPPLHWATLLAEARPARPRSLRPEVPVSLEAIILRALALEPTARYSTAAELALALEQCLDDLDRSG